MNELILIRGLPGSGKTTLAKAEYPDHVLCEADQFFTHLGTGEYNFIPELLSKAHKYCQEKAKVNLENGHNVVVANTFTRIWEMQPYLDMGYPVKVITATGNYKNVHNVPAKVIEKMRERFEEYPN